MELLVVAWVLFWLIPSFIVGHTASSKGRSAFGFWLISMIFSPVLAFAAIAIMPMTSRKRAEIAVEMEQIVESTRPKVRRMVIEEPSED
jgi:hypothetical protein